MLTYGDANSKGGRQSRTVRQKKRSQTKVFGDEEDERMTSTVVAVGVVAVFGAVGLFGYLAHRFVDLLQTEVNCMETLAARQERKAERINRAIQAAESVGEGSGDETGETPTEDTVSEDDGRDGFRRASQGSTA